MGHDTALFKEKPHDEFICSICFGVFNNPVVDDCGHIYCAECIFCWFQVKDTCPISCKKIKKENIRKAPLPFTNLISALKIKCSQCSAKYVRLDQFDEGCPDCRVHQISNRTYVRSNPRRTSFGQSSSTRLGNTENFWEGEWVKWAGVAGAVGAGLLVLMSSMKNKNRD